MMKLDETIKRILEIMELPSEEESPYEDLLRIYPNGGGSDTGEELNKGEKFYLPLKDMIPNEPFKDFDYMQNSENVSKMVMSLKSGMELPPVLVVQHPLDEKKYLVVDGNHRLAAHKMAKVKMIPTIIVPHNKTILMEKPWKSENNKGVPLDSIQDEEKINVYFVKPDGTNNFDKEQ